MGCFGGNGRPISSAPLSYVASPGFAIPLGSLAWFEAVYLFFGLSGGEPPRVFSILAALVSYAFTFAWPLFHAQRPAQVVKRGCQLGLVTAGLLPVVTIAVMMLWQNATGRPDLGMGGMMLHALPLVAIGLAMVFAIAFGIGLRLAERRLHDE